MKKIPTIFERDWSDSRKRIINKPHPDCGWVFAGEGVATRKLDGTCCLFSGGKLYRRREVKMGQPRPVDFVMEAMDRETGHVVGWVPVGDGPEDKYHREAMQRTPPFFRGTYELIGPNIQGNPERATFNQLVAHASLAIGENPPRDFDGLKSWLDGRDMEGLVFQHMDGRMGKIKLRDFGLKRSVDK